MDTTLDEEVKKKIGTEFWRWAEKIYKSRLNVGSFVAGINDN